MNQIYVILMSLHSNGQWGMASVDSVISSREVALAQMDDLCLTVERGDWSERFGYAYSYEVISDRENPVETQPNYLRDIQVQCKETGQKFLYRLVRSELDSNPM